VCAAGDDVEEVADFEIFAYTVSDETGVRWYILRTTLHCGVSTRDLKIASADVRLMRRNAMPSSRAVSDHRLAENRTLIAVEDAGLTCRLLHR
jgi:hypothetical protein